LELNVHDHVVVLMVEGKCPLAIGFVGDIIRVVNDLPKVLSCEGFCVKPLARDIADGDEYAFAIFGVRNLFGVFKT
jgi:hypothetical protein